MMYEDIDHDITACITRVIDAWESQEPEKLANLNNLLEELDSKWPPQKLYYCYFSWKSLETLLNISFTCLNDCDHDALALRALNMAGKVGYIGPIDEATARKLMEMLSHRNHEVIQVTAKYICDLYGHLHEKVLPVGLFTVVRDYTSMNRPLPVRGQMMQLAAKICVSTPDASKELRLQRLHFFDLAVGSINMGWTEGHQILNSSLKILNYLIHQDYDRILERFGDAPEVIHNVVLIFEDDRADINIMINARNVMDSMSGIVGRDLWMRLMLRVRRKALTEVDDYPKFTKYICFDMPPVGLDDIYFRLEHMDDLDLIIRRALSSWHSRVGEKWCKRIFCDIITTFISIFEKGPRSCIRRLADKTFVINLLLLAPFQAFRSEHNWYSDNEHSVLITKLGFKTCLTHLLKPESAVYNQTLAALDCLGDASRGGFRRMSPAIAVLLYAAGCNPLKTCQNYEGHRSSALSELKCHRRDVYNHVVELANMVTLVSPLHMQRLTFKVWLPRVLWQVLHSFYVTRLTDDNYTYPL